MLFEPAALTLLPKTTSWTSLVSTGAIEDAGTSVLSNGDMVHRLIALPNPTRERPIYELQSHEGEFDCRMFHVVFHVLRLPWVYYKSLRYAKENGLIED